MQQYIVLASDNPEDITFAGAVAKLSNLALVQCRNVESALPVLTSSQDIVATFIDMPSEDAYYSFQKKLFEAKKLPIGRLHPNTMHFITPPTIDGLQFLGKSPFLGNMIYREFTNIDEHAKQYAAVVRTSIEKIMPKMQSLMRAGASFETMQIKSNADKRKLIPSVRRVSLAAGFSTRVAARVAVAVDEIVMNAIFDAPKESGESVERNLDETKLPHSGKSAVEIEIGFDGNQLGVMVSDRYGSLEKHKLLSHVSREIALHDVMADPSETSAGIGLASARKTGCSMFFICNSGIKTQVYLFFQLAKEFRKYQKQFRFFSTLFY